MAAEKYSFRWVELARIVSDLEQEREHLPGPDWDRVEVKSIDLTKLAKAARRDRDSEQK